MTVFTRQPMLFPEIDVTLDPRKARGGYYTPDGVVNSLVSWAVRGATDRLLDPACGDGRFLLAHPNSFGVEHDPEACASVNRRAPGRLLHQGDFFIWASRTSERFDCAAGNPPFIRYQRFTGEVREAALRLCRRHGASFSSLSSSWAPFLVAAATLLKPGGRMAFVVPAEIGHAPYAAPLIEYLVRHFDRVHLMAVREKFFPKLSEDCWLLYTAGFGGATQNLRFTPMDCFRHSVRPPKGTDVPVQEWRKWNSHLRPFLLSGEAREMYQHAARSPQVRRLGDMARVGIGYVTGANDFFHLRPSVAERFGIPRRVLHPAVRSARDLVGDCISDARVKSWLDTDLPVLLLRLDSQMVLTSALRRYLDSDAGYEARATYKCRNRNPWYVVPDVSVPDAFLSYMSGNGPALVGNPAGCVCPNTLHAVHLNNSTTLSRLLKMWRQPLTILSCELEGHPLGGGMLKLEPREAARVLLAEPTLCGTDGERTIQHAIGTMRRWRHYAD